MRLTIYCVLMAIGCAVLLNVVRAQTAKERAALLLPSPIHLTGIVTDIDGKPLVDAWVDHTGIARQWVRTNAEGRFEIQTRAPAIVFRKNGFNSRYYRVERDAAVEIQLESDSGSLHACATSANCLSLKWFLSTFCLPKVRGVKATTQGNDIDYVEREFVIKTPGGTKGIRHGAGPNWGLGIPSDDEVWSSVEYHETNYRDLDGDQVVDARGKASNGEYWRFLARSSESATYYNLSADEAELLDKVLDGVCLRRQPQR